MTKAKGYSYKPNGKKNTGRPTVVTAEKIAILRDCFLNGFTDEQAQNKAGISEGAFNNYCREHPDFKRQKEIWKHDVDTVAKANLVSAIREGDKMTSQWWLERKCKQEFSKSPEVVNNNNNVQTVYVTKEEEALANEYIETIISD